MKQIDEARLETDLKYRYDYVTDFLDFGEDEAKAIHAVVGGIAQRIPEMVEKTYEKLLSYDATARHFVPRQHGFEGKLPDSIGDLSQDHEQIQFRKEHLSRYFMQLIGHAYDAKMVTYLDMVGKIHTPKAGNRHIIVPLVQMNVLIGVISDVLLDAVFQVCSDHETAMHTFRAFNKLMWVQNDLVTRHYTGDEA